MIQELTQFEKSIKKKHRFGWTPKFEENFQTQLSQTVFVPIVCEVFEELGWHFSYRGENEASAKTVNDWGTYSEVVSVSFDFGQVKVKSATLGNGFWDYGRNSKRVKLFIHAFEEKVKTMDRSALQELEEEVKRVENWDDYEIPKELPPPPLNRKTRPWIPIVGGIIVALLLGFCLAFLTINLTYVIVLFEVLAGLAIGFAFKYFIRWSNITFFTKHRNTLIGVVILTYLANQNFFYQLILFENPLANFSFGEFIKMRFEQGLTLDELELGWIGLVISWILQFVITFFVAQYKIIMSINAYQLARTPAEVVNFAYYHFVKEKTEDEVRVELSKMGWKEEQAQNEVFESIGAIFDAQEFNKID